MNLPGLRCDCGSDDIMAVCPGSDAVHAIGIIIARPKATAAFCADCWWRRFGVVDLFKMPDAILGGINPCVPAQQNPSAPVAAHPPTGNHHMNHVAKARESAINLDQTEAVDTSLSADIAKETLTGDLRDFVLNILKHEQDRRPWNERHEAEQRTTILRVEELCKDAAGKAIETIVADGRPTIKATLSSLAVKDNIKGIIEVSRTDELRHALQDAVQRRVLIIVADVDEFDGEREPVEISPDQKDIEHVAVTHAAGTGKREELPFEA